MASSADLVVRVLADTSQANTAFAGLSGNIGKALGVGTAGLAAAGVVAVTTQAAMDTQTAMAKLQVAMNSADFAPGTAKFTAAKAQIQKDSTELATSFDQVASVYAQGARFMDSAGSKLSTDKLNEYTDTVIKLGKVSTDNLAPNDIGQYIDVFAKLYNTTDFAKLGNEVADLAQSHNQGEGITFETAIPIAQIGAGMGVTPEQTLGTATYLADRGAGGAQSGASISRMFQRMDTAADNVLDPQMSQAAARKDRNAQEHLDDLQSSLAVAEQRASQMYGQHGLKTAYQRDPAALMASQNEIAKLKREIADSQADMSADTSAGPGRGQMDIKSMARVAGVDAMAYASEIKNDPMTALLEFTKGLHDLPAEQHMAALKAAGITNVRDIKTADVLAAEPEVLAQFIAQAQNQGANGTALNQQAGILLDTTASKATDVASLQHNAAAAAGETTRQGLDALDSMILKLGKDAQDSSTPLGQFASGISGVAGIIVPILPALAPFIANKLMGAGGAAAVGGAGSAVAAGTSGAQVAAAGGGALSPVAGVVLAAAAPALIAGEVLAYKQSLVTMHGEAHDLMAGLSDTNQMRVEGALKNRGYSEVPDAPGLLRQIMDELHIAQPATTVTIGAINAGSSLEQVLSAVSAQITAAWNAASSSTPVSGSLGGNLGAPSPAH